MFRWLAVAAVLVACTSACKGKGNDKPPPAAAPKLDIATCGKALDQAMSVSLNARIKLILDGCHVCGDWTPILDWQRPESEGGPKRTQIDEAMQRCGYCDGNGKQRFLGTLDNARGTAVQTPWRQLGDICKERVSAAPDPRFMSAPYFALDRIARAIGSEPGMVPELRRVELPLPALSIGGTGPALPQVALPVEDPGRDVLTVLGDQLFLGTLPRARLEPTGVTLDFGDAPYPGTPVALTDLPAALATHSDVLLIAPHGMPAAKLVPIIKAIPATTKAYLAAASAGSPATWQLPEAIPYDLHVGAGGIAVPDTVQNLAAALVAKQSGTLQE